MKKTLKRIASLLAAVAVIMTFGVTAVFAETAGEEWSEEDIAELEAYLEQYGYQDYLSGSDVSGADVSGSDISGSDVVAEPSRNLSTMTLTKQKYPEFGLELLVPDFEEMGDIYSDAESLSALFESDVNANALFEISYGGFSNYVVYGSEDQGTTLMVVTYTESNWSRFIGDYSKLSAETQERIAKGTDLLGMGEEQNASFRIINGTTCLVQEYYDAATFSMAYVVQAIVDGGVYEIYLQVGNTVDADFDTADEIINSINIKGVNPQRYGTASTTVTGWLLAAVVVLFVLVALLMFFVVRFSLYAKASGSSFNIIGFSLPEEKSNKKRK